MKRSAFDLAAIVAEAEATKDRAEEKRRERELCVCD